MSWLATGDGSAGLKDPHSAQKLDDGSVLVSDTGRSRLLWIDAKGVVVRELRSFSAGGNHFRLNCPRYAELYSDRTLLVVDSGNNRILAASIEGELLWELSDVPGSRLPRLSQPRWAQRVGRDEVVVSDYANHRILHLRHSPGGLR